MRPQSNQRGIETADRGRGERDLSRLNRTSVGLKRIRHPRGDGNDNRGLNRTSVGLKHAIERAIELGWREPQSNQRGIETRLGAIGCKHYLHASIEPAWD